jgi:hypothetical protein
MELDRVERGDPDLITGKYTYNEVWACSKCSASFHYLEEDLEIIVLKTKIREQEYGWTSTLKHNQSAIMKCGQLVQAFDFVSPDITPVNVREKIKTYLSFL